MITTVYFTLCTLIYNNKKRNLFCLFFGILILTVKIFAENNDITTYHKKICKTRLYTVKYIQRKIKTEVVIYERNKYQEIFLPDTFNSRRAPALLQHCADSSAGGNQTGNGKIVKYQSH